jgi:zinc/manganese transport system substrate-binding protein
MSPRRKPKRTRSQARVREAGRAFTLAALVLAALAFPGCGSTSTAGTGGKLRIVAAENFWGSIASQLAGNRGSVQSIIVNPATDPHSYEPKAADARSLATAQFVIVNGVGYDPWAPKLLAANPASGRATLNVGELLHLKEGDNPHRWYSPQDVDSVARAITTALEQRDPKDRAYFDQQHASFESQNLAQYHALIARIKRNYAGVPVGASESIFALQAPSLGLALITPPSFMKAISEGTEVSAADTVTTQHQITAHRIKVWIYNSQNSTPQIGQLNALARKAHIPIATVTETLTPPQDSFEQWQVTQLQGVERALHAATGR